MHYAVAHRTVAETIHDRVDSTKPIMQVEILSGKELTNPPEVSFELLLSEQKPICGFVDMVGFHTLLRCRRTVHAIQGFQVNRGETVSSISCVRCGMSNNQKGRMAKVIRVVGCPNSTGETIEIKKTTNDNSDFWFHRDILS